MYCILEETSEMRKVLSVWELPLVSSSWASSSLWKTLSKIQKKPHTHTKVAQNLRTRRKSSVSIQIESIKTF